MTKPSIWTLERERKVLQKSNQYHWINWLSEKGYSQQSGNQYVHFNSRSISRQFFIPLLPSSPCIFSQSIYTNVMICTAPLIYQQPVVCIYPILINNPFIDFSFYIKDVAKITPFVYSCFCLQIDSPIFYFDMQEIQESLKICILSQTKTSRRRIKIF